ncbi:hypothetical protein KC343_g21171 [Hortaea werneckii]|nr:hypothetical protein KC343_g21171 [Hortaea werneckii]
MTLASIRSQIWRGGGDILLYYKANGKKDIMGAARKQKSQQQEAQRQESQQQQQETEPQATDLPDAANAAASPQ